MKFMIVLTLCLPSGLHGIFDMYLAHRRYGAGDVDEARRLLYARIADNPLDWRALYNAGVVSFNEQKFDDAIIHLEKVLEIKPDEASARTILEDAQRRREEQKREQQQKEEQEQQQQQKDSQDKERQSDQSENGQQQDQQQSDQQKAHDSSKNEQQDQHKDGDAKQQDATQQGNNASAKNQSHKQQEKQDAQSSSSSNGSECSSSDRQKGAGATEEQKSDAQKQVEQGLAAGEDALQKGSSSGERYLLHIVEGTDQAVQKQILQRAMSKGKKSGVTHDW